MTRHHAKKCHSLHPFSDLASIHTHPQTCLSSLLRLEQQQKRFLKIHVEIAYFSFFLSYSFGIETINTFVHSRSSLVNHTLFQTKMNKVCNRFQTKTAQKPYPLGRHILIWHISIGEYPPPPPREACFKSFTVKPGQAYSPRSH